MLIMYRVNLEINVAFYSSTLLISVIVIDYAAEVRSMVGRTPTGATQGDGVQTD